MAKTGFTLNGNLIEISAGKIALTNLISLGSKPFQFEDFDIFRQNSTETALLDFIPNNHIFAVEANEILDTPNTIIELKNISDSSPGITNNLSVRNGDLIIGESSGVDSFATITGVSRQKVIDRGTITTSTRTNVSRVSDTPVRIKKQNSATYSPDTGKFTFGTDIQFGFSDGDKITQMEILKYNPRISSITTSILDSPATIGSTIYPLEVFDKAKNDAGQISFKLRKFNSPNSPVIFKLPPVTSVKVSNAGNSAYNGNYFYHPASDHYYNNKNANADGNPVDSTNAYGFFKFLDGQQWRWNQQAGSGGPSSTQLGGSGQASLPASVTEDDGFWSVPTNQFSGSNAVVEGFVNPMTFSLISRDSPDVGTNNNSPSVLQFREDALIRFTRNNTVTQKNFLSIVPPTLDNRLSNGAQDLQDLSDNVEATTSIGMTNVFDGFENIDAMYNTISSESTVTEDSDLYSDTTAFQKVFDDVNEKIGFYDSIVKTKLDKTKNYHDKSGNEFIIEGTIKIQDPDLTVGNPSSGIKTFTDSPVGLVPAPYIAEFGSASRAFSTFDGPWDSNSTNSDGTDAPKQSIHTKGNSPGHADFVEQISVPTLSFKNRFILGDFSSPTNISTITGTDINSSTAGFDFKMPILIEETDELLGTTELVEYFLLLKQET